MRVPGKNNTGSVRLLVKLTLIFFDSQGCLDLARTGANNKQTKYIYIRYFYTRNSLQKKLIDLVYCPTNSMIADIFTTPLCKLKYEKFRDERL